jgi:hypothetical protein
MAVERWGHPDLHSRLDAGDAGHDSRQIALEV